MSETPTTLLMARHGDVAGIAPPRFRGRTELELSEQGHAQAEKLAARLVRLGAVDAVYRSPRERCRQTAEPFLRRCSLGAKALQAEALAQLDDIDYGGWTWRAHQEVEAETPEAFRLWHERPELMRFPDGESLPDVLARAADGVRLVLDRHAGGTVLFVTHDSVVRALVLLLTGLPLAAYHQITVSPCSLTEFRVSGVHSAVIRLNETGHLDA